MGLCGPQLIEKGQIGGRYQSTDGTAETLTAADFATRMIVGTTPEYSAGREPRNIARGTLTPLGSIEGKKSISIPFSSEVNTPDTFVKGATFQDLDVDTITWQSGNIVRITFNAAEDITGAVDGDYLTINYATNSQNCGTFPIVVVVAASDYVDILNTNVTSNAYNESTDSPAIADIQVNLEYQWAINACGMRVYGMSRTPIGAVTSGPFTHGETITQDTTGATGRVVVPAANGDSYIYYEPTNQTQALNTYEWTGGSSGATATASADADVNGYFVKPRSDCQEVATVEYQEDGYAWSARDALGTMTLAVQASQQGFFEFNMTGPRGTIGTKALTTSVTRGTEDPPICKNADLTLDSFEPVFSQFGLDIGNTVVLRENGNAADDTGYEGARITKREPKFTLSCEHELAATYAFFAKLDAGTKIAVEANIGTASTKQFWLFVDELELDELPLGDLEGIRTLDISGTCTGDATASGDDEFEMAFIGN